MSRYSVGSLNRRQHHKSFFSIGPMLAVAAVLLVAGIGFLVYDYVQKETVTFTLESKERVENKDGGGAKYLLFTDKGTFKVGDSWVYPRFNSSDVYGRMKEGTTYQCEVYGWRIGFFSAYKNILGCKVLQSPEANG